MTNAKKELLDVIGDKLILKCATIKDGEDWEEETDTIILKLGYSEQEYLDFLTNLDFSYDSGYGGQNLFGTVWLTDGTWLSRGEYDGSEWWEHNIIPEIPQECLNKEL